jgi:dTDP-4-dehydrorhamnose 3,5-epimerase
MSAAFSNYQDSLYDNNQLLVSESSSVPGLLHIMLVINGDDRGWFKEQYQEEKLRQAGFPSGFTPIQCNVSSNKSAGVLRGVHGEPWNKYISLTRGQIFVAIVDLRKGENFGKVQTYTLTPGDALYIPKGCGNSYLTLSDDVDYCYLVDAHWSADAQYCAVNAGDPALGINWPMAIEQTNRSAKDLAHPLLKDVTPMEFSV